MAKREGTVHIASAGPVVIKLSELVDGQEAVCFAALVRKSRGVTARNQPFLRCIFRDKRVQYEAMLWHDHKLFSSAETWTEGEAFRLEVRGKHDLRYGMQIELLGLRPVADDDAAEGYDFYDLVESSHYEPEKLMASILARVDKYITEPHLNELVKTILSEHETAFSRMPAAQRLHHPYTSGLLEHVWSMTRVAGMLVDHYAEYYHELDPPLDKGVVIAASILHDIGKLRELRYHPVEAKYTKEGCLVGHVQMGRDLVRETAQRIGGIPTETLLLLEHAILSHHGKYEFGAPVLPQTVEALLVSYIDDLDAKLNIVARERMCSTTSDEFTDRIYALDNRRIYKGVPEDAGCDADLAALD